MTRVKKEIYRVPIKKGEENIEVYIRAADKRTARSGARAYAEASGRDVGAAQAIEVISA